MCLQGPLTNIALAIKLEPRIVQWARSWYVMGGAYKGRGNASFLGEVQINFNGLMMRI
jgi:purine nucleosidase